VTTSTRRRPARHLASIPEAAPRVALYLRQSQDTGARRGDAEGLAVERQEKACRDLAERRDWTVDPTLVFTDNSVSASKRKPRPRWTELLRRIEAGEVDVVIAWAMDRLLRRPAELEGLIDLCEPRGVRVITVQGDLDFESPQGKLAARTFGNMARFEADQKAARQIESEQQAVEMGRPPRRRAFGYVKGGQAVEPAEAEAIVEAYRLVLAGSTLASIARMLNDRGVTTTLGRPWEATGVRTMLLNARNAAIRTYYGDETGPGTWPAIVPVETYRMTVAILSDPARRTSGGSTARKHLGAGLYRCGVCAADGVDSDVMTAYRGDAAGGGRIYRCRLRKHLTRLADPIDEWVTDHVREWLARPEPGDALARVGAMAEDTKDDKLTALLAQERTILATKQATQAEWDEGDITTPEYRQKQARQDAKLTEVRRQMADLLKRSPAVEAKRSQDPLAYWDALDVPARQALVADLVSVVLLPGRPGRRDFDPSTVRFDPPSKA
jgi:DNA invertase Pin-like site-specific DNA recombinase